MVIILNFNPNLNDLPLKLWREHLESLENIKWWLAKCQGGETQKECAGKVSVGRDRYILFDMGLDTPNGECDLG